MATNLAVSIEIGSRRRLYVVEVYKLGRQIDSLPASFRQSISLTKGSEERKLAKLAQTSSV